MRVVADTNVLVSGLLWPGLPAHFLDAALRREFPLLTSEELLAELEDVLSRAQAAQEGVGLHGVLGVEDDGGVRHELNAWVVRRVQRQPTVDDAVRNCVISADWRTHIDDSFDQLGLLHLRQALVATQEFAGVHELPAFQRQRSAGGTPGRTGFVCHG